MKETDIMRLAEKAHELLSLEELSRELLPLLANSLECNIAVAYRLEASGAFRFWHALCPEGLTEHHAQFAHDDPLVSYKRTANPVVAITSNCVEQNVLQASAVWNEVYEPAKMRHQLACRISPLHFSEPGVVALVLVRERAAFRKEDERALLQLHPALLGVARREARLATGGALKSLEAFAERAGGAAAFSASGELLWRGSVLASLNRQELLLLGVKARRLCEDPTSDARARWQGGRGEMHLAKDDQGQTIVLLSVSRGFDSTSASQRAAKLFGLSRAEEGVLRLLALGMSNADVGQKLFVSTATVRTHVHRILTRMGVSSRLEAVARLHDLESD